MDEYASWVAAKIATLQNNLDTVEDEYNLSANPTANLMAAQYQAEVELLTQATMRLGFVVQLDGPRRRRTCVLRLSSAYTSHPIRKVYR